MATVAWDQPPAPASATAAERRPITVWAAIGLALATGVFVFVSDLRYSLQTNALVAGLPPGSTDALSTFAIWAPAIVGAVLLLVYAFVALRLHRRRPGAVRAAVILASIYIAFSLLNIAFGRVTMQAAVALALNGALIALVLIPVSRNYLRGGPAQSS